MRRGCAPASRRRAIITMAGEIWEQAIAALLCGKNLLLTGGKATGKNVLAENLAAAFGRPGLECLLPCEHGRGQPDRDGHL